MGYAVIANVEPANWQVEPDPEPALYACLDCEHEEETDQHVDTCERCGRADLERYTWDARTQKWTLCY